jgi:hypothetical protein
MMMALEKSIYKSSVLTEEIKLQYGTKDIGNADGDITSNEKKRGK